jgi:hypothetical protein
VFYSAGGACGDRRDMYVKRTVLGYGKDIKRQYMVLTLALFLFVHVHYWHSVL